ncbi:MAG: 2Fe-2S iron-sulfur cluster-binding protein [Alphaproteobacteria bacterium]|nr:2Fe-2S iron-sulfur cluster-binding protein [Alphaproteobacteria bacterium]
MRASIRFLRRGKIVDLAHVPPMRTVLDYLRLDERSRGTKEGCNEGDCGACTVALGVLKNGKLVYEPVNACILLVGQLDGKELVTVDDLADGDTLHPVQQALVDTHGSQCGFCTPGFVMSLFTLYQSGKAPTREEIATQIAGNLCRCTGYRPIIDAGFAACTGSPVDRWAKGAKEAARQLAALDDGADVFVGTPESFIARPAQAATLARLTAENPDATIVSGATDVGLWITKQMRQLPKIILTGGVTSLHAVEMAKDRVSLGAAATYAEATPALSSIDPDVAEVLRRLGSTQVRASGTVGGNIDFFIAYGKQDRKPGELVWRIDVPKLKRGEAFRAYKISKRFDQDISAVMAAFKLMLDGRTISSARIAFGGMAATPKRGAQTEAALQGASLDQPASWKAAIAALAKDFQPISDMRASATYRIEVAQGLLKKALMEVAGADNTRVLAHRKAVA